MSDLEEFHHTFIADIQGDADALGVYTQEAFFEKAGEILTEAGEIDQADYAYYEGKGRRGVPLQVTGSGGDPADAEGILSLILCDFQITEEVRVTNAADLRSQFGRLVNFLTHARDTKFCEQLEETSLGAGLADLISTRWNSVEKIKLVLVTNSDNRAKVDAMPAGLIDEKPVTYNVWDLKRLQAFMEQGKAREDLTIDFEKNFGGGIPVLKASASDVSLESYIAVIPGAQLAAIYDKWGARLLESNVRSFLQARGNVNQGIRKTILEEPYMFFAYNNGLAVTAENIEIEKREDGLFLTCADNFQIVNGGQTTASIHAARKAAGKGLDDIYVQMKLSVVPPLQSDTVVPRISEYANSQNKVNAADFFANHPFHVKVQELSRKILAPAGESGYRETKWFYERARGQFADERGRRTTAERKKWDAEFPRQQFFTKTDLAKFENSWAGLPHIVSKGAQKNFATFARTIEKAWGKSGSNIDEVWFRKLIAKAIIFRRLEKLVSVQGWYEGGYRANIVTYAIAKLVYDVGVLGRVVDLNRVWRFQALPAALENALLTAAIMAQNVITHPPVGVRNMSEWAKKQACWENLRKVELSYPEDFSEVLAAPEEAKAEDAEVKEDERLTESIELQKLVFELGAPFWKEARDWGRSERLLSPLEFGVLDVCSRMPEIVPSERQTAFAMKTLEKLKEKGFVPVKTAAGE